jgi:hypothetical protein
MKKKKFLFISKLYIYLFLYFLHGFLFLFFFKDKYPSEILEKIKEKLS